MLKKAVSFVAALVVLASAVTFSVSAESKELDITTSLAVTTLDGSASTYFSAKAGTEYTVSAKSAIKALYIVFNDVPGEWKLNGETVGKDGFLHEYIDVESVIGADKDTLTLVFPNGATVCDVYGFDGNDTPSWVQKWSAPCEKADLLLISSHADDEQLFFAGILPYYTTVKGYNVQVAYATDHSGEKIRHHERLNGLWTVGVRNYPVSTGYADLYSESVAEALANLAPYGVTEDKITEWESGLIDRFEPQVIVTHDVNGEYGHGMHKLVSATVQKAVERSKGDHPELKKVYLHLYGQSPITLGFLDTPFDELGGKTPFAVTQQGFMCHNSQHWTWFKGWLYGKSGEITSASQIATYNPRDFGLFYSSVGEDTEKNDFFENVKSYKEQEREAAEAESSRIAYESALAESEKKRAESEAAEKKRNEAAKRKRLLITVGIVAGAVVIIIIITAAISSSKKKKRRRGYRK